MTFRNRIRVGKKSPMKYFSVIVEYDGYVFRSIGEKNRYRELKLLEAGGEISDIKVHPPFPCRVNGFLVCTYYADFSYKDIKTQEIVTEDFKGYKKGQAFEMFKLKAKLVKAIYGVDIVLIRAPDRPRKRSRR